MPRLYKVTFSGVAVSAPQDLLQVNGASGKIMRPVRVWCGFTDTTLPTAQGLQTRCRRLPATVTNGSGGSTPAIVAVDPGDAVASFTAFANNTTKATTNGTAVSLDESGDHLYSGTDRSFPERPPIGSAEAFVFELLSTFTGTVHLSGGGLFEEIGG